MFKLAVILFCLASVGDTRWVKSESSGDDAELEVLAALLFSGRLPVLGKPQSASPTMNEGLSRRQALSGATVQLASASALLGAIPAYADDEVQEVKEVKEVKVGVLKDPKAYELVRSYPQDARNMLDSMKIASEMSRGSPNFEQIVVNTRKQMNEFVSFYRRQTVVSGTPSFSTLYTAINTLSGHYASYGNKYPVPEKRRVRLQQQYKEIERALARGK